MSRVVCAVLSYCIVYTCAHLNCQVNNTSLLNAEICRSRIKDRQRHNVRLFHGARCAQHLSWWPGDASTNRDGNSRGGWTKAQSLPCCRTKIHNGAVYEGEHFANNSFSSGDHPPWLCRILHVCHALQRQQQYRSHHMHRSGSIRVLLLPSQALQRNSHTPWNCETRSQMVQTTLGMAQMVSILFEVYFVSAVI